MPSKHYDVNGVSSTVELGKSGAVVRSVTDGSTKAIEARNNVDDAYVKIRADHPVDANDVVTLRYLQTKGAVIVLGQIDGGGSIPSASPAGRMFICTTTGTIYTVKYLYYANGSSWEEVIPSEGLSVAVTDALTGGTIEFEADHKYIWDADGSTWLNLGVYVPLSESIQCKTVDLVFGSSGSVNIGAALPANATVLRTSINVVQAFNGAAPTVKIGDAGVTDNLMSTTGNSLKETSLFITENSYLYVLATQLIATYVADGSSAGSAKIIVQYLNA